MSFFKKSTSKEDLKQGGSSGYLNASGCYPVNIIAPFVSVSPNGSTSVDLFVEHEKQKQVIYGNLRVTNNDGSPNQIGSKVFNQLLIIADLEDVAEPIEAELPIGKNGKEQDVSVLEDLADIDVLMRIQMEYNIYNGNIQEKKVIKAFFRAEDNASAEEIVNGEGFGSQYEKESSYFDNVTYKDGLDAEAVAKWISEGRPKGTAGGATGTVAKKGDKPSFGKKRKFGSKD